MAQLEQIFGLDASRARTVTVSAERPRAGTVSKRKEQVQLVDDGGREVCALDRVGQVLHLEHQARAAVREGGLGERIPPTQSGVCGPEYILIRLSYKL